MSYQRLLNKLITGTALKRRQNVKALQHIRALQTVRLFEARPRNRRQRQYNMEARPRGQHLFQYFGCCRPECQSARVAHHSDGPEWRKTAHLAFCPTGQVDQEGKLCGHSHRYDGRVNISMIISDSPATHSLLADLVHHLSFMVLDLGCDNKD